MQAVAGLTISRRRAIGMEARSFQTGFWAVRFAAIALALGFAPVAMAQANPPTSAGQPASTGAGVPVSVNPAAPSGVPQASQAAPVVPQAAGSQGATQSGQLTGVRPALTTSVWQQRGEQVTDVRFEGVVFSKDDTLLDQLTQKAGTKLDPEAVRADLRRLFASGRYRDISVRSEKTDGGIALVYAGVPRYYIGRVQIVGVEQRAAVVAAGVCDQARPGDGIHRGIWCRRRSMG